MVRRKTIEVDLGCEEALALVEASFEKARTSPTRTWDGGWMVERKGGRLLAYPRNSRDYLLDPLPDTHAVGFFPETLAVEIVVVALPEAGTRVTARIVRHRVLALMGILGLDLLVSFPLPFVQSVMHGIELATLRRNRRAAKVRMLGLALEPLLPYQRQQDRGPFR